jgi:Tfp pilus assembly protein PilF
MSRLADNAAALRKMQGAEHLDSSYALTHLNLGFLYARMQDHVDARTQLERTVQLNRNLQAGHYILGSVYHHLSLDDKSQSAYEHFRKVKAREKRGPADLAERLMSSPSPSVPGNQP